MPCYEFYCKYCDKIHEVYYHWKYGDGVNYLDDVDQQICPVDQHHGIIDLVDSLTTMRPDRFWNGVYMESAGCYTTSESRYNRMLKEKGWEVIGDRTDKESLTKIAAQANKEKDIKAEKQLNKFIVEQFQGEEFGIMGTVEERNNKMNQLRQMESESPEDICVDPGIAELVGN